MNLNQTPFPSGWWGTSLANVGLEDQRPDVGTYGRYEYASLPPLPGPLDSELAWLAQAPPHASHIGNERAGDIAGTAQELEAACRAANVSLPASLLKFLHRPDLHARVRSNTDCFIDVCAAPVPSPVGEGMLVRFLADSQGCIFWYLYIPSGASDQAVVCSPDFYDPVDTLWDEGDGPDPDALVFCAESFDVFLYRFWIENELWFAEYEGTPVSEAGRLYIERYRNAPASALKQRPVPPDR